MLRPAMQTVAARLVVGSCIRSANATEILDYIPGGFRVVRHVRPKLSCRTCETIVQAPAGATCPSWPRQRRIAAHVAVAKYCDHQPLHRQAEQYARADIDLSRSTLG